MDEIPGATDYVLAFVQQEEMPALLVALHVVTAFVVQLPRL